MTKKIQPLTHSQQIFLQRLLSSHTLTNVATQALWNDIETTPDGKHDLGRDLKHTLSVINQSLKSGFNMEIRSISLALKQANESVTSEIIPTIYYAIVNCEPDHTNPALTKTPHELAFIRLVLERLIEICSNGDESDKDEDEDVNDQPTSSARKRRRREKISNLRGMMGCEGSMSRMDLINLRTDLSGPHKDKLSISQVEHIIDKLEVEKWLVPAPSHGGPESPDGRQVRRKNSSRKSDGGTGMTWLQIGPRTYMELPDFLCELGMNKCQLPQLIFHG